MIVSGAVGRAAWKTSKINPGPPATPTITFVQKSSTLVQKVSDTSWESPGFASLTGVAAGNLLLTMGGWWDSTHGNGGTMAMPTDSNGTISAGVNPTLPDGVTPPGWPVGCQIGHQLTALSGTHQVTPQNIADSGDGYFVIAEFNGSGGTVFTKVDGGNAFAGSATAGGVDGVTVNTAGASAQIGDLVVAVAVTDGDPSAVGVGAPTSGGYTSLLSTSTTLENVSLGIGWKVATVAGQQSAAWVWADSDCKIGFAAIAVYRRS